MAVVWHYPLSYHGNGYWRKRVIVQVANESDQPQIGIPVTLTVGAALPSLPLAGEDVKAIRVCDEQGLELQYDLRTSQGTPRRNGSIQVGDQLSFFVELPPRTIRNYFIYADNPEAWLPPEFIRTGLVNGSFETGEKDPDDWERVGENAQHKLAWVIGIARTGKRSVQTIVAESAQPTWVNFQQTCIPVLPNRRYRLQGWVKAQSTKGTVGWFICIFGEKGECLINQVLNAGDGTYDWRPVEFTFTVPENGRYATVGTVLYGTGTAWFDDVSLELVDKGELPIQAKVVGIETMNLTAHMRASSWMNVKAWHDRVPIVVYHFGEKATTALVYVDLRKFIWRFSALKRPVGLSIVDPEAPQNQSTRPHWRLGNGVLFLATLPPKSAKRFDLYLSAIAESKGEQGYEALLLSPANLVPNPSFEEQEKGLPKLWRVDQREGVKVQLATEGKFGNWAAKLEVTPNLQGQWVGWHLSVPVKPNQVYLYFGFIKAENNPSPVRLHGHWLDAEHRPTKESPFFSASFSTRPDIAAGQGWVQTFAFVESPPDAAFAELHLTTNTPGTFWHDGIFFGEVYQALVGDWERHDELLAKGLQVWSVNPLIKVFPDTPPEPTPKAISVLMARNEYESVQIALRSDRAIRQVHVEVIPPRNAQGQTLPSPEIWRVGYVLIDRPTAYYFFPPETPMWYRLVPPKVHHGWSDGWSGEWPDPLIPFQPFDLQPNRTEAIWLVLYVPPDAPSGHYEGQVCIVAEKQTLTLPLQVEVVPLTLPQETELVAIFDLSVAFWEYGIPARVISQLLSDPERLKAWYRSLIRYRISPGFIIPEPTFRYEGGKVIMDTKGFDEMAHLLLDELKVSVAYTPSFLYAFGWAYSPKRFFNLEPFTPEYNSAYQMLLQTFFEYVRKQGWGDKFVYYISDEPRSRLEHIRKQLKELCKLAHDAIAGIHIYSSTWGFVSDWVGDLDIWGVGPHGSCSVDDMERLKEANAQLWFTTDGHMCIDTPYLAIERLLPYLCFAYGVSGYEFWGVAWWTYDPWERGWHAFIRQSDEGERYYWVRYPNGDGYLVYPGERFGKIEPLPSIRLMQVREGIEDYLLIRAIERHLQSGEWQGEKIQVAQQVLKRARKLVTIPNQGGLKSTVLLPDPDQVIEWHNEALRLWWE